MKHFYKTAKRQIFILIIYTLSVNFFELFIYEKTEKWFLNPLLLIIPFGLIHVVVALVYTTTNHQDDRKKLKNYLLTIPIILILSIIITITSLFLNN
jgi:putative effector of murein hydrolase